MPISASSNSAANKHNMMSKIWINGVQLSDQVEKIVGKAEIAFMSNFFFSHNVFKSCLLLMHQNEYLRSKGLRQNVSKNSSSSGS